MFAFECFRCDALKLSALWQKCTKVNKLRAVALYFLFICCIGIELETRIRFLLEYLEKRGQIQMRLIEVSEKSVILIWVNEPFTTVANISKKYQPASETNEVTQNHLKSFTTDLCTSYILNTKSFIEFKHNCRLTLLSQHSSKDRASFLLVSVVNVSVTDVTAEKWEQKDEEC